MEETITKRQAAAEVVAALMKQRITGAIGAAFCLISAAGFGWFKIGISALGFGVMCVFCFRATMQIRYYNERYGLKASHFDQTLMKK